MKKGLTKEELLDMMKGKDMILQGVTTRRRRPSSQ